MVESRFLENFRVRAVYSPALVRALTQLDPGDEKEYGARWLWPAEQAESWAQDWNKPKTG